MNKFEINFIIIDLIANGLILWALILMLRHGDVYSITTVTLIWVYYFFKVRKLTWKNLEKQEKEIVDVLNVGEVSTNQWGK
jgi:ABC-type transport system involved in Fe-S cluster assembly fused permease/ATPase subunit|tara:strand:+ start:2811 stop:3053 length:243 start_codon:yes stop_codon:yes gene_type:complete